MDADIEYKGFEALYRKKWQWDSIGKSTHQNNCWYQRNCSFNVYVKEGIVWREEQAGVYEQVDPNVPDYNPRGCQKGACYSHRMYDSGRLTHPLKRIGERGEGKWQRISWEQAMLEVADKVIDAIIEDGPGSITYDTGGANAGGCNGSGLHRAAHLLDAPILDINTDVGDHHPGAQVTVGKISFSGSMDDLFYSDLILIWGGNPVNVSVVGEAGSLGAGSPPPVVFLRKSPPNMLLGDPIPS